MKKIPTLFLRDPDDRAHVLSTVNPAAAWVLNGEGIATRKHDGTSVLIRDGAVFRRYELKPDKTPPPGFEPADRVDPNTGKQPGWVPVGEEPESKWHRQAIARQDNWDDGTYELIGPKIQGNPEGRERHVLVRHGSVPIPAAPRDFAGLQDFLLAHSYEGIVWHHPDGRMAKLKRRDFEVSRRTAA